MRRRAGAWAKYKRKPCSRCTTSAPQEKRKRGREGSPAVRHNAALTCGYVEMGRWPKPPQSDWGSRGREFKSPQPDHKGRALQAENDSQLAAPAPLQAAGTWPGRVRGCRRRRHGDARRPPKGQAARISLPVTGRAELHDEVVHREQLWLTREPDLLEHGSDHLTEPLEGLG